MKNLDSLRKQMWSFFFVNESLGENKLGDDNNSNNKTTRGSNGKGSTVYK